MKKVIISADDFGYSDSVNKAIIKAHSEGILTSASLMVAGDAFESAVQLAKENPRLGIGLHLVLVCGKSVLPHSEIPDLVNVDKNFSNSPTLAGMQYYLETNSRKQLEKEIIAQFQKFKDTGLHCTHVDSHLHMHVNPAILDILLNVMNDFHVPSLRISDDDLSLSLYVDKSHYTRKVIHNFIFGKLSRQAKQKANKLGIQFANKVYGLFQTGEMSSPYTSHLLQHLPDGVSEIYFHPDFDSCYDLNNKNNPKMNMELETLLNPKIKELVSQQGIELITYKDI